MWNTVSWRQLTNPDIAEAVDELRYDTLSFLTVTTAVIFVVWHVLRVMVESSFGSPLTSLGHWGLAAAVGAGLVATHHARRCASRLAPAIFVGFSALWVVVSAWLLATPTALMFVPLIGLTAVVMIHPLAGVVVVVGLLSALTALRALGPLALVETGVLEQTGAVALLTVLVAWALGRNLVVAVEWSLISVEQAISNAQAARRHRAELVRALKQVDIAYYRLERANAALELAWKAAEMAERSKAEFVTNISHELRTPLNLIIGFSEMILVSPESYGARLPAAYRGDLNAIYRSAQHLMTLTNDVIDLARIGAGRLALAREPVDFAHVIADANEIVREYISAKGLALLVDVESGLPLLSLDRLRVRQVLLNLLTNAARFTERGEIAITARSDGDHVLVRVSDSGRGITTAELSKVFDEFHHGEADPATGIGGIGLGLPISRRFVELHGGQMGVESTVGVGTSFWFTLPIASVNGLTVDGWRPANASLAGTSADRVLVVVGEDGLASFLGRHLRGFRVVAAPNADRAVRLAIEYRATAIITDVDERHLTASASPVPVLRLPLPRRERVADALGAVAYLLKPVTRQALHATIERMNRPVSRIMIADDDTRFVRLIARYLRSSPSGRQFDVVAAHNGREALDQMRRVAPDLILLDMAMPELNGADVIAAMRADDVLANVPAIVVSAQDEFAGGMQLEGNVTIERAEGLRVEELLSLIEAVTRSLDPPRRYLTTDERPAMMPGASRHPKRASSASSSA